MWPSEYPPGLRPATLDERREFYEREFEEEKFWEYVGRKPVLALVIERYTGIYLDRWAHIRKKPLIIRRYRSVREKALKYLPEGVYYDRNIYRDPFCRCRGWECFGKECFLGQELAFDLDPENIRFPGEKSLKERIKEGRIHAFDLRKFEIVKEQAGKLYDELKERFSRVDIVYSGRGFHVSVRDKEAIEMDVNERKKLTEEVKKRYAIDPWVSDGRMRLIRAPYTLHAEVSRIVLPLKREELEEFSLYDPRVIPAYQSSSSP